MDKEPLSTAIADPVRSFNRDLADRIVEPPDLVRSDSAMDRLRIAQEAASHYEFGDRVIITPFVVPTVLAALFSVIKHPATGGPFWALSSQNAAAGP